MNALCRVAFAAVSVAVASTAFAGPNYQSGGFEAPRFVAGSPLIGQDALQGPWTASVSSFNPPATVTAQVGAGIGVGGSQGVQITRTGDASGYFSVVKNEVPTDRFVEVHFDMKVAQSTADFGPFFGVQVYGGVGNGDDLIGSVGVDASTGEVLYQSGNGTIVASSLAAPVAFGQWNSFDLLLDYASMSYFAYVNGTLAGTSAFNYPETRFFDAPLVAFEAAGTPSAFNATGSATFDNYSIAVPEPTTLAAFSVVSLLAVRRRLR